MPAKHDDRGCWRGGGAGLPKPPGLVAGSLGWMLDSFDVNALRAGAGRPCERPRHGQAHRRPPGFGDARASPPAAWCSGSWRTATPHARPSSRASSLLRVHRRVRVRATVAQLPIFRVPRAGDGRRVASGAALVSETGREHRGKGLGFMQSAWPSGTDWRPSWWPSHADLGMAAVFFVACCRAVDRMGPARVEEQPSGAPKGSRRRPSGPSWPICPAQAGTPHNRGPLMNACTMFAWWGSISGSRVPLAARPRTAARPRHTDDVGFIIAMQWHVFGLRHLRFRQ